MQIKKEQFDTEFSFVGFFSFFSFFFFCFAFFSVGFGAFFLFYFEGLRLFSFKGLSSSTTDLNFQQLSWILLLDLWPTPSSAL